jgi:hypothetical protein
MVGALIDWEGGRAADRISDSAMRVSPGARTVSRLF